MTLIEKFSSFSDFESHYRSILKQSLVVDDHIYFLLHHPTWSPDGLNFLREYYANPNDQTHNAFKNEIRSSYMRMLHASDPTLIPMDSASIDTALSDIMSGSTTGTDPYDLYLYPWSRSKFALAFYDQIFPSCVKHYFLTLQSSGHFSFKKSSVLLTDIPFEQDLIQKLINDHDPLIDLPDIGQIISDLKENVSFYKNHYQKSLDENRELQSLVDQLSQQISTQTLTRWY